MYISLFWCGVLATVIVEVTALLLYSVVVANRNRSNEEDNR